MRKRARLYGLLAVLLLTMIPILSQNVSAESGDDCDYPTWKISETGEALFPSGRTDVPSFACEGFADKITKVIIPEGVTWIGRYAFEGCINLKEIVLPSTLTEIEEGAFFNCNSLKSISLPAALTSVGSGAFSHCNKLQNIEVAPTNTMYSSLDGVFFNKNKTTLIQYPGGKRDSNYTVPSSVIKIESGVFSSCIWLKSVTVHSGLTSMDEAFKYNTLSSINVEKANAKYASQDGVLFSKDKSWLIAYPGGIKGKYIIPSTVKSVSRDAFIDNNMLEGVAIPASLKKIPNEMFAHCDGLKSVTIKSGVTAIGDEAFSTCKNLKSISIPASVTSIGEFAFYGCTRLTTIKVPTAVTRIQSSVFSDCTSLTSISLPSKLKRIDSFAFNNCRSLKSIEIPASVKVIDAEAFGGCNNLKSIHIASKNKTYSSKDGVVFNKEKTSLLIYPGGKTGKYVFPSSVRTIGEKAFYEVNNLTSFTIPSSVTKLEKNAFYDCYRLKSITIPASVKSMGESVFRCCNLKKIIIKTTKLAKNNISSTVFDVTDERVLVEVPKSKLITYKKLFKASGLSKKAIIVELPKTVTIGSMRYIISMTGTKTGTASFAGTTSTKTTSITIPSKITYKGISYPVTRVVPNALKNYTKLRKLVIGKNVFHIGGKAFYNCKSLKTIIIKSSVLTNNEIGQKAFSGISDKVSVSVPASQRSKYKEWLVKKGLSKKAKIRLFEARICFYVPPQLLAG